MLQIKHKIDRILWSDKIKELKLKVKLQIQINSQLIIKNDS